MSPDQVGEKVLDTIATVKRIPREKVSLDSSFEELGLDSLDAINITFELEQQFDLSVSDDQVRTFRNVRDVVNGISQLLAAREQQAGAAS